MLRIDYNDAYEYLMNARALVGHRVGPYLPIRPPLLSFLQMPAVALACLSPAGSVVRFVVPHLLAAVLSAFTAAAVFWVYRRPLGTTLAALGTALFVATPYFVRYGAHAMADVPSAGLAAVAIALHARARERGSAAAWALCGLALGGGVLMKYPLALVGVGLAVSELGHALVERRLDTRRWGGLVVAGVTALAVFVGIVETIVAPGIGPREYVAGMVTVSNLNAVLAATHRESWRDYWPMSLAMMSPPIMLLALAGLARSVPPRADDIPFLAWLIVVGGGTVFLFGHNEARYLLPALPAVIYLAVRGLVAVADGLGQRSGTAAAAGLVTWAVACGVQQAWHDRDPVFRTDVERRAAEALLAARGHRGRLLWLGNMHTFHTRDPVWLPDDEYFDVFHYSSLAASYFLDEPVGKFPPSWWDSKPEALVSRVRNGDAIVRAADVIYETRTIPPGGVRPLEVWAIHRLALKPFAFGRFYAREDPTVWLRLRESDGRLLVLPERSAGRWFLFVVGREPGDVRAFGEHELHAGREIALGEGTASAVGGFILLRIERTVL